jgi:dipeptidyl aminopeptidase/acylaminoacyl peptidase
MFDRDWPNYGKPDAGYEVVVGSPRRDAAQFQGTSIASIADRIKSPVLMAYGKDDKRIPMSEGRAVFEKIAQGNPKAEWYQGNGQEQDWSLQENRIEFWRKVSEFLDKSIGQ